MTFFEAEVTQVQRETADSVTITLGIPQGYPAWKAGQYFSVDAPVDGGPVRRSYSFSAAPHEGEFRYTVKRTEGGLVSVFFNTVVQPGRQLRISEPEGNFVLKPFHGPRHLVFFAAGSGITPVRSLIFEALKNEPDCRITLFAGNRTPEDFIFKNEWEALKNNDQRFRLECIYSGSGGSDALHSGRITFGKTLELVHTYLRDAMPKSFYICGPGEMINSVKSALEDTGIHPDLIHTEFFSSPSGAENQADRVESGESGSVSSVVTATLDGDKIAVSIEPGGPRILDALLDAGADAPYSCKGGVCSSCKAKLTEGEVKMDANYSLTDKEVSQGYILTCQSRPITPVVKIDYDDV